MRILSGNCHSRNLAITRVNARFRNARDINVRVRFPTVALHLGDVNPAADMLEGPKPDEINKPGYPENRTAFIHGYEQWPGDIAQLAPLLKGYIDKGPANQGNRFVLPVIRSAALTCFLASARRWGWSRTETQTSASAWPAHVQP